MMNKSQRCDVKEFQWGYFSGITPLVELANPVVGACWMLSPLLTE